MNQLTTIAALPQAGGCMSALSPEVNEAKKPEPTVQMKAAYFKEVPPTIEELARKYLDAHEGLGC